MHSVTFSILFWVGVLQCVLYTAAVIHTNEFAVHIDGGEDVAQGTARKYGFHNRGQIGSLEGHYLFEFHNIQSRSNTPSLIHSELLQKDSAVLWCEQQEVKQRVKKSASNREIYLNEFTVHIEGGEDVAQEIARKYGFHNVGKIGSLGGYYLFKHHNIQNRSDTPSLVHSELLQKDSAVLWCEQQEVKRIVKRSASDREIYLNEFAVHIDGGGDVAQETAQKYGFYNRGQIESLEGYYLFEQHNIQNKSDTPSLVHSELLQKDSAVLWCKQQEVKRRAKRSASD